MFRKIASSVSTRFLLFGSQFSQHGSRGKRCCLQDFPSRFGDATTTHFSLLLTPCSSLPETREAPAWAFAPAAPCPRCYAVTHPRALLKQTWEGGPTSPWPTLPDGACPHLIQNLRKCMFSPSPVNLQTFKNRNAFCSPLPGAGGPSSNLVEEINSTHAKRGVPLRGTHCPSGQNPKSPPGSQLGRAQTRGLLWGPKGSRVRGRGPT